LYKTDQAAYKKTLYASPPYGGSGSEKPQSGFQPFERFSLRQSLPALVLLRKPLFGLSSRRIQQGHYV